MSPSLTLGAVYVICAALTALLPMRRQMWPGLALLIAAPLVLGYISYQHGWVWFALGMAAFLSMFRNPLIHLWRMAKGERPELPK